MRRLLDALWSIVGAVIVTVVYVSIWIMRCIDRLSGRDR